MAAPTTHQDVRTYYSRALQLTCALPAALIWLLLGGIAALWWIGVLFINGLGPAGSGNWRVPYLMVLCTLALGMAVLEALIVARAVRGRSRVRLHALMFAAGILFIGLMGIVGD